MSDKNNNWKKNWRNRYCKQNKNKELSKRENRTSPIAHNIQKFVKSETVQCSLNTFINITGQYNGWKFYFPNEVDKKDSHLNVNVTAVEEFIARNNDLFNIESIEERRACIYDLKAFLVDKLFMKKWPSFKDDLIKSPSRTLDCLGLSIHKTVWNDVKSRMSFNSSQLDVPLIKARVINHEEITQLKNLKTGCYGKLVSVCGTVIRVGNSKLQCSWMAFQCIHCSHIQCVKQPDGTYCLPTKCSAADCHHKTFTPLRSSQYTQTYDWQSIQLQELVPDDQREGGRVPRTIECELTDDLVGSSTPGDIITVTGIVKVRNSENINHKKGKAPSMFQLYIEAVSIVSNKNLDFSAGNASTDALSKEQFTQKDYNAIREIHSEPSLFKLLVNSICPTIYGHEMVKAGLILSLFGGSQSDNIGCRGHIHVLIVGDPGLGKSQMLQACSYIVPRGVFVCGNATTSSGLTVTLTREGGGDYALEAGALVLADQGCCCIDEFDKMTSQHQALLEVMEQQTVSIAKAGVICTLPARTTVLAAANPAGGHYNKGKTVAENLRLGQALLSRFDLVFILLDQPNEYMDTLLSEHVMALHSGIKNSSICSFIESDISVTDTKQLMSDRLKIHNGETMDLLPAQLLRKYIAYAKKYVPNPTLSEDANKIIQNFYLQLRAKHQTQDSTPVTTRQLLSLIRLTQARAKLELREEATGADALDVVELMRWSLVNTFSDEFGMLDFQRSQHGSGMSSKNQAKRFLSILHKQTEIRSQSIFSMPEMKQIAKAANIEVPDFFSFISTLNNQGFLLKKGKNQYQILSAE